MRRGIEAQVALLTNGNGTHAATNGALSDDDTLADTASVSTLDDDVPHKEKQKVIFSVAIEIQSSYLVLELMEHRYMSVDCPPANIVVISRLSH